MVNKIITDSFELLYVYIMDINRCLNDIEFSFTNEYEIEYDESQKKLIINKKNNNLQNFFGDKIKSINLIVGKNGSGKTTLFDLLGLKFDHRNKMFDLNDQCGWFALYKTNLENKFYIEGYNSKLIFKEAYLNKEEIIKDTYSLFFDYSYDDYKYANLCFSNSYYHRDCPFIFYDKEIVSSIFFSENKIKLDSSDYSCCINREYIKSNQFSNLYYLATKNNKFFKLIEQDNLCIQLIIPKYLQSKDDVIEEYYGDYFDFEKYKKLNIKEKFVFKILKNEIADIYFNVIDTSDLKRNYLQEIKHSESKSSTLDDLFLIFKITCDWLNKIREDNFKYYEFVSDFCKLITELPEKCYEDYFYNEEKNFFGRTYINEQMTIKIDLNDTFDSTIYQLLVLLEIDYILMYDFKKHIIIHLNNNISDGELKLINIYSGLFYALTNHYKVQKSAIIILDEPDKSLHPEWISYFIKYLVEMVNSIDNDLKYQIIISTHSPFMLSDVPKEWVNCIDITNHKRSVIKPKKTFASNYYDLIQDNFFLDSPLGKFATDKINNLIKKIQQLDFNGNYTKDSIDELVKSIRNEINVIDDDYLKSTLLNLLNKEIANFDEKYALEVEKEYLNEKLKLIEIKLKEHYD